MSAFVAYFAAARRGADGPEYAIVAVLPAGHDGPPVAVPGLFGRGTTRAAAVDDLVRSASRPVAHAKAIAADLDTRDAREAEARTQPALFEGGVEP